MQILNQDRFEQLIQEAKDADFTGWDFSWLDGRMAQQDPPWDYAEIVRSHLTSTTHLLDMGTGGGEFLASLAPLPEDTHATESYPPNQAIADTRLSPLGVKRHMLQEGEALPFPENHFDLILNRHDSFVPEEIYFILKPGGVFITQQVGGLDNLELNQMLEDQVSCPYASWDLAPALTGLYAANLSIIRAEKAALQTRFLDIGAVVYYLRAIPWQVPGFSVETHWKGLVKIHNLIERQHPFVCTAHRFLAIAQKE